MISNDAKSFAVFALASVFPSVAQTVGGEQRLITELGNTYPGLDARQLTSDKVQRNQWAERSAEIIVDHLMSKFDPNYRATA